MKRFIVSVITVNIIFITFMSIYFDTQSFNVYAESSVPDGYSPAGVNDQVDAFRYYCKSRNLAIEGSVLEAVTQVTSKAYQTAVSGAGFDMNELQNEIYKSTGSGQNFFFTVSGISAMNRIFAEFLQNNNLSVGDTDVNKTLDSGRWFVDADGNGCKVATGSGIYVSTNKFTCNTLGTAYIYTWEDIKSAVETDKTKSYTYHLTSNYTYNLTLYWYDNGSYTSVTRNSGNFNTIANWGWAHRSGATHTWQFGDNGVILDTSSGKLYFGYYANEYFGDPPSTSNLYQINKFVPYVEIPSGTTQNYTVTINSTVINNNNYEGDTIINQNGQTVQPTPPTPPPTPPDNPNWGDPNDGNSSIWNTDNNGELNFPLINLPDFNIDWSLKNILHKFPFCIPGDLVALVGIFDADPTAPHFEGDISMGNITTWHYNFDFSVADDLARFIRIVEFIAFIFGLIYLTIHLVKG